MNNVEPKEKVKVRTAPDPRTATKSIVYTAMFAALICVCSILSIPIGAVPVTLQTFAVCAAVAFLGGRRGTICVMIYLLLGAVGLPVFAGMTGGFGMISGPTGGYLIGFLLTACITGFAADKLGRRIVPLILWMSLGVLACYIIGTVWFMLVTGMNLGVSLGYCVIPFLIPDAVKIAAAALLVNRLDKVIKL